MMLSQCDCKFTRVATLLSACTYLRKPTRNTVFMTEFFGNFWVYLETERFLQRVSKSMKNRKF